MKANKEPHRQSNRDFPAEAICRGLNLVLRDGFHLDKAQQIVLKERVPYVPQKKIVAAAMEDIVRNYLFLTEAEKALSNKKRNPNLPDLVKLWWRFGGEKKLLLDRKTLAAAARERGAKFSDDVLYSWPKPLWDILVSGSGPGEAADLAARLHFSAPRYIRVNTLKANPGAVTALLSESAVEVGPAAEKNCLEVVDPGGNLYRNEAFSNGWFEVQDINSQAVSLFFDPLPGERVIDACAGAGGKTLHMAALMENKGKIIALDVSPRKLEELKKRSRKAGAHNIETRVIDSSKVIKKLKAWADKVLLDVPCSGLGVVRRNPDIKFHLEASKVLEFPVLQLQLLTDYSQMVKPGGKLVYATCSILPAEGEDVVLKFLSTHPDWSLAGTERLSPGNSGGDGFYMARLIHKKGS